MKWEVTMTKFAEHFYKVTRMIPELGVSETRVFTSKKEAQKQFEKWLA